MQKLIAHKQTPSILLVAAVLLLGILITPHYGESWDELKFFKYAGSSLQAYSTWLARGEIPLTGDTYDNYGPVYVMAVQVLARLLAYMLPWMESDLRHLLYFFSYAAGIWAFYRLGKRWLSPTAALGAALLFATQPLLWGHAFISPKDIPFLSLFLLSLHFGLQYFDSPELPEVHPGRRLVALTLAWLALLLVLFGGTAWIHAWLDQLVRAAAAGQDNLISRLAADLGHVAPEVYIQKFFVLFLRLRAVIFLAGTLGLLILYRKNAPEVLRLIAGLLLPGLLLGLTVGVRVLGPLAGLLVAIVALRRHGRRALPALLAYFVLAAAAMYATWPYLWPDPTGHFIESLVVMAKYPWQGEVLFNGALYESSGLPASYLPVLLGIQLTEPVWVLSAIGLGLSIWRAVRREARSIELLWMTALWFVLPILALIALRSPLYDNFRQVFFLLPPVFFLAGVVFDQVRERRWAAALIAVCVLPGIVSGVRLHPYEYIYYNRFIGGQQGAFRRFEMDYWGTSYREAAGWLDEHAAANGAVWADGPAHLLETYLRPDLKLFSAYEQERREQYDYSVSTSRYDLDLTSHPQAPVIYSIERDGAILTVIKRP